MSFDQPVVCPILIGRSDAIEVVEAVMRRVETGAGHVLLIAGDAGVGKSRLLAEAIGKARERGLTVLQGACFEHDSALAYAPLLDLVRTDLASRTPADIRAVFGEDLDELVQILPELRFGVEEPATASSSVEPEQAKRRVFGALGRYIGSRAVRQPLLVVVEDLHWSDDTSLEFLAFLARSIAYRPIQLIFTYRSDEVSSGLAHLLAGLDRERLSAELVLTPLPIDGVDSMIRATFGLSRPVPVPILTSVHKFSEGNPFFVEEILRSLVTTADPSDLTSWATGGIDDLRIPRSVKESVQRRTSELRPQDRQTLLVAAVAGRRFDFALLQELVHRDERSLVRTLKQLVKAHLVVEESDDRFAFRHALVREAIYDGLLTRERRGLHHVIAETLERNYTGPDLDARFADLAYHFFEAGVWGKAQEYARLAGERDQALHAPRLAVEQFTRALEAARRGGEPPSADVLRARGRGYETLGDFDLALADLESALALVANSGAWRAEWQVLLDLGMLWAGRDYARGGEYYRQALKLARSKEDREALARSLNRFGNWLVNTGKASEGLVLHHEALDIFESRDDKHGAAETLDLLGMAFGIHGQVVSGVERYGRAISLFRELGNDLGLSSSLGSRAVYACPVFVEPVSSALGTLEECASDSAEALRIARQVGSLAAQSYAEWTACAVFGSFGEFGLSLEHGHEALRLAQDMEHRQWQAAAHFALGQTYVLMLEPRAAIRELSAGLPLAYSVGSSWWIGNISSSLASAYLLQDDLTAAAEALQQVISATAMPGNLPERRIALEWGRLLLHQGDVRQALEIADRLTVLAGDEGHQTASPGVLMLKAECLAIDHRVAEALTLVARAKNGAIERQARPLLWRIHAALGKLRSEMGQAELAAHEYADSRNVIDGLAGTIPEVNERVRFSQRALATLPKQRPLPQRRIEAARFSGLSAREREVAALVARGKSNSVIASLLVVSERTVEAHVSSILSKLDFGSRSQIAVWASNRGLADTEG